MANADDSAADLVTEYVTMTIGDHMFGLPIFRVQDVFVPARVTRVPLAPPEVAGILNLRGRVVTAYVDGETANGYAEDWDLDKLWSALRTLYPVGISKQEITGESELPLEDVTWEDGSEEPSGEDKGADAA